jgi:glycosyltransferase involved in cell wall biosynthesis
MEKQLKVAYIFLIYPSLHKTFVDREIITLRRMGVDITIYSLQRPETVLSPYQKELKKGIAYIGKYGFKKRLLVNLRFLLRKPWAYVSTLVYLFTRPHPADLSRQRTLMFFFRSILLTSLLEKDPPDHIHSHFLNESASAALIASRMLGIPYSNTAHASSELFVTPRMIRAKLSRAKFIATCTRFNLDYLTRISNGLFDQRIKVVYHGLDCGQFKRQRPFLAANNTIVGVGQLKERKGYQYLIEACAILRDRGVSFQCNIIGEGLMRPVLEEKIDRLGLRNFVQLCGAMAQEDVIHAYEEAAIFCLPVVIGEDGDQDGIPNVILEAMAMELPVVSTHRQAIEEVIEDGVNGLLVQPGDAEALANALETLLNQPELRRRMGDNGRKTVLEKFDPEKNAQLLINEFLAPEG